MAKPSFKSYLSRFREWRADFFEGLPPEARDEFLAGLPKRTPFTQETPDYYLHPRCADNLRSLAWAYRKKTVQSREMPPQPERRRPYKMAKSRMKAPEPETADREEILRLISEWEKQTEVPDTSAYSAHQPEEEALDELEPLSLEELLQMFPSERQ